MLETCRVHAGSTVLSSNQSVQKTDWELYISNLAAEITKEQSPQKLMAAREKLYELLVNCIPASVILKMLAKELTKNLDDELKFQGIYILSFVTSLVDMHISCSFSNITVSAS